MKRTSVILLCAAAVFIGACEQHKATELHGEHGSGDEQPKLNPGVPSEHPRRPTEEQAKAEGPAAPTDAPKFFPEKK